MNRITILSAGRRQEVDAPDGASIAEILRGAAPGFNMPCAGNHTCGKCRVRAEGQAEPITEQEARLLSGQEREQGVRLACFLKAAGDLQITVEEEAGGQVLSWAKIPPVELTEPGLGFAVDIGTTTVAMRLYDRRTGEALAEELKENRQRSYGADVISRISACAETGVAALSQLISAQLEEMARACLFKAGAERAEEAVVTGNSTMLHLYEGLDPASLAVSPFAVKSYFGTFSRHTLLGAPVYLPRLIGAYVGADIVCAILASGMTRQRGACLLADIGTNGEMALWQDGRLTCCATAAGPAFEGAGLSCGMPAKKGAVRAAAVKGEKPVFEVIGGGRPQGVCGSGILDALRVLLELETLEDTGFMEEDYEIEGSGVYITKQDVRQIQLAKSAVCAGLYTLMEEAGAPAEAIGKFFIAGGFGSSMDTESAAAIGLIPQALGVRAEFIGNGALGGASMLLFNKRLRRQAEALAENARELALSASPVFMERYIDCMSFERM